MKLEFNSLHGILHITAENEEDINLLSSLHAFGKERGKYLLSYKQSKCNEKGVEEIGFIVQKDFSDSKSQNEIIKISKIIQRLRQTLNREI